MDHCTKFNLFSVSFGTLLPSQLALLFIMIERLASPAGSVLAFGARGLGFESRGAYMTWTRFGPLSPKNV